VKSYSETIKAVEAALATRVTPQNPKQTLGTMIADVRNAPQNFEFAMRDGQNSSGVQTVLAIPATVVPHRRIVRWVFEAQAEHDIVFFRQGHDRLAVAIGPQVQGQRRVGVASTT
jgi:hypothetical protein